ncbi:MAG: hypothetical protein RJA59_375 [Pseudomonadota bacterium]|jgi:hypothetical protein
MAQVLKVLGQADLAATTLTAVYTVPASTKVVISSIVVCNRNAAARTFRLAVAVAGAADDPKQYLVYDATVAANESLAFALGITLAATDVLRAYASAVDVTVQAFGSEQS